MRCKRKSHIRFAPLILIFIELIGNKTKEGDAYEGYKELRQQASVRHQCR